MRERDRSVAPSHRTQLEGTPLSANTLTLDFQAPEP